MSVELLENCDTYILNGIKVITQCQFDAVTGSAHLDWDESCGLLQDFLANNPEVCYYAAPAEDFSLVRAANIAISKGCEYVIADNLS